MRIALWLLVLVTVCAGLLLWNERITQEARAEREVLRPGRVQTGEAPSHESGDGFGHAIVGEKSGAPIIQPSPRPTPPPGGAPGGDPHGRQQNGTGQPSPSTQAATEHVVAAGESLSTICQAHYGTSKPEVVAAVARANKIEKPAQIRAGTKIVLPPLSELSKNQR